MKKFALLLTIIVIFLFSLPSCNDNQTQPVPQKTTTTVTTEKVTYSNQGFYVEQQVIVKGNTVWGINEKIYGTGLQWRDIVALNPFLNNPDRLYYNPDRKMWIVRIYPGEVLNIGGQKVYPSCTYENTTTTTTTEPVTSTTPTTQPSWSWLWFVAVAVGLALIAISLLLLIIYFINRNRDQRNEECGIVRIPRGANPDTVLEMNRDRRKYEAVGVFAGAVATASNANFLSTFNYKDSPVNGIELNVNYRDTPPPTGQQ